MWCQCWIFNTPVLALCMERMMSGLVSVSWKRHCIYICQHNVWQNIFLKLAYLPEYFTRTHACAHVPAIWCSCTLLSWRVKIRCACHVKTLHKVLLTCKRCLALSTHVAKQCICTVTYVYCEMRVYFSMYIFHMKAVSSKNNWVPAPALGCLPGSTNTSFTLILLWCFWQRFSDIF